MACNYSGFERPPHDPVLMFKIIGLQPGGDGGRQVAYGRIERGAARDRDRESGLPPVPVHPNGLRNGMMGSNGMMGTPEIRCGE